MGDCTKEARVLVTKQAPSITECQLRTFVIRSHLPCLCHQPTSTPPPSQPCWTAGVSPTYWTLPHLVPLLSAFLSHCTFSLFPAFTSTSSSIPILLWGLQWPSPALLPASFSSRPPALSSEVPLSTVCCHQLLTHLLIGKCLHGKSCIFVPPSGAPLSAPALHRLVFKN